MSQKIMEIAKKGDINAQNNEKILFGLYGDDNDPSSIGMMQKVDTIYLMYTKTLTIREFIILLFKIIVGGGGMVVAWTALSAFMTQK